MPSPLSLATAARLPSGSCAPQSSPYLLAPEHGNHAAAGAIVGFLIGAIAGATAKTDAQSRAPAALLLGGLGAVMGAAVGHSIPASHWIHRHPSYPAPDDDEMAAAHAPLPDRQEP